MVVDKYRDRFVTKQSYWRALILLGVHLFIALHITHWLVAGTTLAPLEVSEFLRTTETGVINAGFILMILCLVSVLLFGRFFCGWGCHILALQDLSQWLLSKASMKPRFVRSAGLALIPFGAALYLYAWPQIERLMAGQPMPSLVVQTQPNGLGSFITDDLWRHLPGVFVAIATFAICGFAVVYFLGSRGFCRFACPYGALFNLTDKLSLFRIVASDACVECKTCTAVCKSGIPVHLEVKNHGMILDSGCFRDMDCVGSCPENALSLKIVNPVKSIRLQLDRKRGRIKLGREIVLGATFILSFLAFRGLYNSIPFLLACGMAVCCSGLAERLFRLMRARSVNLYNWKLKKNNEITSAGRWFIQVVLLVALLVAHCGFIRYHEFFGQRAFEGAAQSRNSVRAKIALSHLGTVETYGIYRPNTLLRKLASLHIELGNQEAAQRYLQEVVDSEPRDLKARFRLALAKAELGSLEEATVHWERVSQADDPNESDLIASANWHLADRYAQAGNYDLAIDHYQRELMLRPQKTESHVAIGALLGHNKLWKEATEHLETALELEPRNARAHNNLAVILMRQGYRGRAIVQLELAIEFEPDNPGPYISLANIFLDENRQRDAIDLLRKVEELAPEDPRFLKAKRRVDEYNAQGAKP